MATSAGTYADERAFWVALAGITDDTDLSLSDLQMMAAKKGNTPKPLGFNVAQPAIPASLTPQVNNTGTDCNVHITGGTVTVIAIDGNATGLTSGTFRVANGQSITLTYSVAPTWKWFGN